MRRKALTMAILVGTLALAGAAEVRATPAVTVIVLGDGAVREVHSFRSRPTLEHGDRFHARFDRHRFDRHRSFVRHGHLSGRHFSGRHLGRRHFDGHAFGTRVIVVPAPRRSLHRHLPAQPLIRNGFARRSFHWHFGRW